jgi:hypothetical protein
MGLAILFAVLPLAVTWFCLRRIMSTITFLLALAGGLLSLALAAAAETLLPMFRFDAVSPAWILIRTSLIEEGSRLAALALLFSTPFFNKGKSPPPYAAAGLAAGLMFAAVETLSFAAYGQSVSMIGILRLGAAMLHAACGLRCGLAASAALSLKTPGAARNGVLCFAAAAALHTMYNFMAARGSFFTILALLLALSSLVSGLRGGSGTANGRE